MAKRFLESLQDTFDESVLDTVIPGKEHKERSKSTSRRKSFLDALETDTSKKSVPRKPSRRKSFLGALEEVIDDLDQQELEELFPSPSTRKKSKRGPSNEARITTSVDSKLLAKIRKIAHEHGMPLKQVIQEALSLYLNRQQ